MIGTIWMEVDQDRRGKIDFDQFTLILGLISQVQAGFQPNLDVINLDIIEPPYLK